MVLGRLAHVARSISFSRILRSKALVFFFRTAVLRKLFDIRFSYKHCNFSRVCLLFNMASKTVTRPIINLSNHNAPCLRPKILHNHCFQFLLGITAVLREIEHYGYAKFWGVNKVHYGLCENGGFLKLILKSKQG